jgi:hypothetical protein
MEAHAPEFKSAPAPDSGAFRRQFSVARSARALSDLTLELQHLREHVLRRFDDAAERSRSAHDGSAREHQQDKSEVSHAVVDL